VTSTDTRPEVVFSRRGRHLEKWIWRHISAVGASISTKFGSLMQNNVQISGKWSKSKPKVYFQYGGRLFFKNGSSYISTTNWDMSTKFGLLIEGSDINKCETGNSIASIWTSYGFIKMAAAAAQYYFRFRICWYCCLQRSLKVIELGAIRKLWCGFLFAFYSNYGDILYRLQEWYSDLLVKNREIFIPHLYLAPPQGVTPSEFREDVWCW